MQSNGPLHQVFGDMADIFVIQAWERCTAKEWNLSAECLTSKKACMALNNYSRSHPHLHDEIKNRMGTVHGIETMGSTDDSNDDTDVPSSAIIQDALGIAVSGADQASDCVVRTRKDAEHGGLVAADKGGNVWAFNDGEKWGDDLPVDEGGD
jgi:hypothetical protein